MEFDLSMHEGILFISLSIYMYISEYIPSI